MTQNKLIYAVTGGIGSGKSEVLKILREEGYTVFSCDEIYEELLRSRDFVKRLEDEFGKLTNIAGTLDRKKLSAIVFADHSKLAKLNSIAHPQIMKRLFSYAQQAESDIVFCEVPLLFENGFERLFDGILVIIRSVEDRVRAVIARSNLSESQVRARIDAQFDYEKHNFSGYHVINNNKGTEDLRKKVKKILQKIV